MSRQRLTAILAADVAGFSRLMSEDERATVAALEICRAAFREGIAMHAGRVVDTAGDSVLAVFDSVFDAVACAIAVQRALRARNDPLPEARRMQFRIGVNLGDVITRPDGTVYGDGVNIAARIESLAEAGGVAIAGSVRDSVAGKLGLAFADLGEQEVKNIARPVRVYRVKVPAQAGEAARAPVARERPDKPSIAVLPFNNMSGDPEQEHFADGITEDIITELSRFRELFVISRNSSFKFKGRPVEVQKFAGELGVQYVVEGSVRKAGKRVRITVQLIDAETDHHLWAERYDRDLEDIFAIQDEVTSSIVAVLPGRVEAAARDRVARKTTDNMAAYECVLTGKVLHHRSNREDNARAQRLLERAIELDPTYAHAHAWKACVLGQTWGYGWCDDRDALWNQVNESLRTALALDDNDSDTHRILAAVNVVREDFDKALYHQQRALSLNPNDDLIVVQQGEILTWLGQGEEGAAWIRKAMRLNPYHPERFWYHLGRALFAARRYAEAAEALKRVTTPDYRHQAFLAACYAQLGDAAAAQGHVRKVLAEAPRFTVDRDLAAIVHFKQPGDREHFRDGLLKAGLPA
ncbi:MAG: adenylate/guanylate cyclase domain-containing protein [Betaproteobacteria bacterium]|nr:MAG: adenylate/guanylate cyclase domain-containing protein [Betaproteobacteria bacterium]